MVTLKDIAREAGVSVSTVSRVINSNRENPASKETVDRIWSLVREFGYIPNQSAKDLVKGVSMEDEVKGSVGCIFTSTVDMNNDPFFSCIGFGIQEELRRQGYLLGYALSSYNMSFSEIYAQIIKKPVQGIIVTGRFEKELLEFLKMQFKHIVYAGVNAVNSGFDEVICDGYQGAETAINHLIDMGHRSIGYVGCIDNEQRYQSYCDTLKVKDLIFNDRDVIKTKLRTTESYYQMEKYLENKDTNTLPSGFYCANDATAFGVMRALKEKGIQIPKQVAVVGMDDVEMASFVTPMLSTVSVPRKELGIRSVKLLVDQFETDRDYAMRVDLPFRLVVRESSNFRKE